MTQSSLAITAQRSMLRSRSAKKKAPEFVKIRNAVRTMVGYNETSVA